MSLLNGISPGIDEIMSKKDDFGNSGGLLTGLTKGANEALDSLLGDIPQFGDPGRNYAMLPGPNNEPGKGVPEYGMARDIAQQTGNAYMEETETAATKGKGFPFNMMGALGAAGAAALGAQAEWNGLIKENTARLNTVLEERSYLDFYFPNDNIGVRRVCMFENPKMTESRTAKYASKNIVARNEPVRLWVGSDARKLNLKFRYTLPHVENFFRWMNIKPWGFDFLPTQRSSAWAGEIVPIGGSENFWEYHNAKTIAQFFGTDFIATSEGGEVGIRNVSEKGPRFYEGDKGNDTPKNQAAMVKTSSQDFFWERLVSMWSTDPKDMKSGIMVAAHYTQFVIDTIRASVVGDNVPSADGFSPQGPPIVRFRHGTIFEESPFIVKSFTVNYSDKHGAEVRTLLPRCIEFTLQLEEFRQTHGAQLAGGNDTVQGASQIIELENGIGNFNDFALQNNDRRNFPNFSNPNESQ